MTMTDADEIRNLLSGYCIYLDDGDVEKFADLFAEDAIIDLHGKIFFRGRVEIVDNMKKYVRLGKHITLNALVEVAGERGVSRSDLWYVHKDVTGQLSIFDRVSHFGRYQDVFRRENGRWRFAERRVDGEDEALMNAMLPRSKEATATSS